MSVAKMDGFLDAKLRHERAQKARKANVWPWENVVTNPDGSETGSEGYVRTITPDDGREPFTIRGTVRWWRSEYAIEASKRAF